MRGLFWIFSELHLLRSQGLSLIEILVVVSIISILGAVSTVSLRGFVLRNDLETTTGQVVGTIRKAQNYSLDGKNNEVWGVCLWNENLRLFSGTCSIPTFAEDFTVPRTVSVTGLSETTFSRLRGEPSNLLDIRISTDFDMRTVQLNRAGGVEVN